MSGNPKNASLNGDGFRFYRWVDALTGEETDVLSVTSIRTLCGEPYNLVRWQINNVLDTAMSMVKRTIIGPRGGVKEVRVKDEFPGDFARRLAATDGQQGPLDDLRKWLRETAEEPRNIAGRRGTITHGAIEKNVEWDRIERPYVEMAFSELSDRDRKSARNGVLDEDVYFVRNSMRQYWDMRNDFPFTIVGREVQVFNLTAGYAGTFDALVWVHPDDWGDKPLPRARDITLAFVQKVGGYLALLDWKTAKDIYTDNVVQAHAYLSAEFCGTDGVIDQRMTDMLTAAQVGGLVHIRPNKWAVHLFDWEPEIARAFFGSVAFARMLAKYPKPTALFTATMTGESPEEDEVLEDD